MFEFVAIGGICLFFLLYNILLLYNDKIPASIPRPPGVPFFGHALRFRSTADPPKVLTEYLRKYGGTFQLQICPFFKFLVFASPETVEPLLASTKHLDKSRDYGFLYRWLGKGLLTSGGGPTWKRHRKIITPAFHFKALEGYLEVFNAAGEVLLQKLQNEVGKESFDIRRYLSLFTLDAICETAMGISINAQRHPTSEYVQSVRRMCEIVVERQMSPLKRSDFLYPFTGTYAEEQQAIKVLHGLSKAVIQKRKQAFLSDDVCRKTTVNEFGSKEKRAFLDLLLEWSLEENNALTDEELNDEVSTFMFAGHDTTSALLSFAIYCLANNPHIQNTAFEEQVSIFGKDKQKVSFGDLQNMRYLEMVLKETLRMYPSAPVISRLISEDTVIDGKVIPKAVKATVFIYGMHNDPAVYPDPEKFIPERFSGVEARSPYAYIPFSAGSRNCIGQKFAMLEVKATLSKLLRNFEFLPATPKRDLILAFEIVLTSKNGVRVALKPR